MTVHRMTILYGTPADPEAFDRYYRDVHVPIATAMTELTAWRLHWLDADAEAASGLHLIADLVTETPEDMKRMLESEAGKASSADLDNFVTGTVTFLEGPEQVLV